MATTVSDYFSNLDLMSPQERSEHLRENYRVPSQEWPDYLDYLDEWHDSYYTHLASTRKDFIFQYLAKHNIKYRCGNHYHFFTSEIPPEIDVLNAGDTYVYVPSPDSQLDYMSCWYRQLTSEDEKLANLDANQQAPRLSQPETETIRRLTQLRVMTKDGLTFDRLDFSTFKEMWLNKESREQALKIFEMQPTQAFVPAAIVAELRDEIVERPALWLDNKPTEEKHTVIFSSTIASQHHGLHALLRAREDRVIVLGIVNAIRRKDPISEKQLIDAIRRCYHCRNNDRGQNISPSPTGFYYAPPGNGKDYCQNNETFIGIDTDLLVREGTFRDVVNPFLERGIPVITNQYSLAINSGEKLIGNFGKSYLRYDPIRKKAFTTLSEIATAHEIMKNDFTLLYEDKYLSEVLPYLYKLNYFYNRSRVEYLGKSPHSYRPSHHNKTVSYKELQWLLNIARQQSEGIQHRRKVKIRKALSQHRAIL